MRRSPVAPPGTFEYPTFCRRGSLLILARVAIRTEAAFQILQTSLALPFRPQQFARLRARVAPKGNPEISWEQEATRRKPSHFVLWV